MNADERLALIRVKVEWAKQHIHDLKVVRDRFFSEPEPYRIHVEQDPQTGQTVYRITNLQEPPVEIALRAGDVIHNLRSALDHLAYQLVLVAGKTPTKQTAFPFWELAREYEAQRHRRVQGMRQSAIDAIDVTYPYKSGNQLLWSIHELDIADKHHALLVTFNSLQRAMFQIPDATAMLRGISSIGGFRMPSGVGKPLKDGDILFVREADMHYEPDFTIDIALAEPEIVQGHALVEILQHLSDLVDGLIISFRDELV